MFSSCGVGFKSLPFIGFRVALGALPSALGASTMRDSNPVNHRCSR
jgi:hypothetical protein